MTRLRGTETASSRQAGPAPWPWSLLVVLGPWPCGLMPHTPQKPQKQQEYHQQQLVDGGLVTATYSSCRVDASVTGNIPCRKNVPAVHESAWRSNAKNAARVHVRPVQGCHHYGLVANYNYVRGQYPEVSSETNKSYVLLLGCRVDTK